MEMEPFKDHPNTRGHLTGLRTSLSKSSLGNFQHWYLANMLASVYSYCVKVKVYFLVECMEDGLRISNPVTYKSWPHCDNYKVFLHKILSLL